MVLKFLMVSCNAEGFVENWRSFLAQSTTVLDPLVYCKSNCVSVRKNDLAYFSMCCLLMSVLVSRLKWSVEFHVVSSHVKKFHLYNGSCSLDPEAVVSNYFCRFVVTCSVTCSEIQMKWNWKSQVIKLNYNLVAWLQLTAIHIKAMSQWDRFLIERGR